MRYVTPHRADTLCEQNPNSLLCVFNVCMRDGFTCETDSTNAKSALADTFCVGGTGGN